MLRHRIVTTLGWLLAMAASGAAASAHEAPLRVVVLGGSSGSHRPAEMIRHFVGAIAKQPIRVEYTEDVERAFSQQTLVEADALLIYKDDGELPADCQQRLLEFVERGGGLVAVHCASHAFRNSDAYTRLIGGRFLQHGSGEFRPTVVDAQHPIMADWPGISTWDETYTHDQLAADNRMLMVRSEADGYEPATWVRRLGKGRIFYTALGHDERTWNQPAFVELLTRALRWSASRISDSSEQREPVSIEEYSRAALTAEPPEPLSPDDSIARMHLPAGFRVELFAAEPDIIKPLTMACDERGRWWVVESVDYPNDIFEPFAGHDRIKVCEDTDGDGRADTFTIFADRLNIPTGLLPYRDGVIVALAPHIVWLRDTDGDGVSDERQILFTGFGRDDTHAVCSNLRWGPDNWVWATVGYSGGRVQADNHEHRFKQGVIRFRPDGSQFEVLTSTSNNTWGLGFRENGDVFVSTANNQHSVHLALANRYFEQVRGWHAGGWSATADHVFMHPVAPAIRQVDFFGGFTAACGQTIYTARAFPREYWDRAALVCEPTGHLIHIDWLTPRGSDYVARDGWNLLASDDPWTAPIETHLGHDGAVWWIDWYNYIVRHNPTPPGFVTGQGNAYVTPQRDKHHGRIYRIVHDQAAAVERPRLATTTDQVAALNADNMAIRLSAQRLLAQRIDAEVSDALLALLAAQPHDIASAHALWLSREFEPALRGSKRYETLLASALASTNATVRRAAVEAFPRSADATPLLALLSDADFAVRRQVLLTLSEMQPADSVAQALVEFLSKEDNADDRWLPLAANAAAAQSDRAFLLTSLRRQPNDALRQAVRIVSEHWARGDHTQALLELLAAAAEADPLLAGDTVSGLHAGWPKGRSATADRAQIEQVLGRVVAKVSLESQLQAIDLAEQWGAGPAVRQQIESIEARLLAQASDAELDESQRLAAIRQLATLTRSRDRLSQLIELISARTSPDLAEEIVAAVSQSSDEQVAPLLLAAWPRFTPAVRRRTVASLLARPQWTTALLDAVAASRVSPDDLAVDQWQQLVRHPDQALAARATKLSQSQGRLPSADRQQVLDELLPQAERTGDAALGKKVFEQHCAKCHRHGNLGEAIGPDLTGIAVRPREEILTDILDPNRSVEGNFRQYTLATLDGRILAGLLLSETKTALELLDSQAQRHVVLREDLDELTASPLSVMPEGFEKLAPEELTGLLEFLSAKGRFLPLPLDRAATIVSTLGMFYSRDHEVERLIFDDWGPKQVDEVPFQLVDPRGDRVPNAILLFGPQGEVCRQMPRSVEVPCNSAARKIHLLSGVSGWGYPLGAKGSHTMTVRLHYADGTTEDHALLNGVHFADYIQQIDVPESQFAFRLRSQQLRYLSITPARADAEIRGIELVKGSDQTAPVVMAVTVERP